MTRAVIRPGPRWPRGQADTVFAGLGAMLGAGVFAGFAPAAALSGSWLLVGAVLAGLVALCGALSTADQAQAYPGPGGGYRYTRELLGRVPARMVAGAYLAGRMAAMAALAGCFGVYLLPQQATAAALIVLLAAVAVDAVGLRLPRWAVRLLVIVVLLVLVMVVAVCFAIAPPPMPAHVPRPPGASVFGGPAGLLPAAGVLFFAFLGFERATTVAPTGTDIPARSGRARWAIPVLVVIALGSYLAVGGAVLHQLGPARLALSPTPLRDALTVADGSALDPVLTIGVLAATVGALLAVIGGTRRTIDVIAVVNDLPNALAGSNHGRSALTTVALAAGGCAGVLLLTPVAAIQLAGTCALAYYTFTNAAARLLLKPTRAWPARTATVGLGLCVLIALTMPPVDLAVVLAAMLVASVGRPLVTLGRRVARR